MLNIKNINLKLALEDEVLTLDANGSAFDDQKVIYGFSKTDRKITASVVVEPKNGVVTVKVNVDVENHPFHENHYLKCEFPIQLSVEFDETPGRFCASYHFNDWWSRPAFGSSWEEIPQQTSSVLLEGKDSFGYILPMAGEKTKTFIAKGAKSEITFEMTAYTGGLNQISDYCFLMLVGKDPYEIIEQVFKEACRLKNVPCKKNRNYPEMFEYFGWCSWDAFYTDINEEKVMEKVRELNQKQIPVRWILMDDGWHSTKNQCLTSFKPDPVKFPNEFTGMTEKIKRGSMIDWIGVWHAFAGYWGGIAKDSALASDLKDNLYETKRGQLIPHYIPEKGFGFWNKWYSYLKSQGIDFVKVDGQSALKNYYRDSEEIGKVTSGSHLALESAVGVHMGGNIINCMGMASENVFSRPSSCISRNSDDFVPNNENGFQEHLLQNVYNGLCHDQVYACDWDMFWTNHPDSGKHALLRAISGGPVYVSDRIGETVRDEIMPLVYHDGRLLRMDRCAKPSYDCIFNSPLEYGALKLTNTVNGTGALAAFNIGKKNEIVEIDLSPSDIYDLKGDVFGAFNYFKKTFKIVTKNESIRSNLNKNEYALVLFVPMKQLVTPIGLINKYMSAHAVKAVAGSGMQSVIILAEGGIFAFYMSEFPKRVLANGVDMTNKVLAGNGFYSIDLSDFVQEVLISIE